MFLIVHCESLGAQLKASDFHGGVERRVQHGSIYSQWPEGRDVKKIEKLLRFLRDELLLTSVKDGCSEGACGACTVIIDGRTCKACVPDTDLLDGRNIITVEGLTEWEEKVYTYAYGKDAKPFAKDTPTSNDPIKPGPRVNATALSCSLVTPALFKASCTTGTMFC